jgi:hypothetical protein
MINPLIHYELELAKGYQKQLRRKAALWDLAQHSDASGRRTRPGWLRTSQQTLALAFGFTRQAPLVARLRRQVATLHPPFGREWGA